MHEHFCLELFARDVLDQRGRYQGDAARSQLSYNHIRSSAWVLSSLSRVYQLTGLDGPQKDQVGWRGYLNPKSGSPATILGSPTTFFATIL